MGAIVGVHGIGKYKYYVQASYSATGAAEAMRAKWNRYLNIALRGPEPANHFAEVAYFAHLLHNGKDPEAVEPERMAADAERVWTAWARECGIGEGLTGALRAVTGWLLGRMDARAAAAFAARFAPEVATYLTDQDRRRQCGQVVAEVIRRNRPKAVVAHSLGSVVAYEALWANPDLEVDLLVTLGSPLGMRNVVFENLLPPPINGRGERPKGVRRWVNIADRHDIAAIPPRLRECFHGVDAEQLVDLDWIDFHTVEKYLGCGALTEHLRPYLA
ncbi:hypothetical protein [Thermoactinospora rubra]|uniref:hypothetical protein n=1 Tax=Thermoactinospora rubra TaxID=1088767 RepID=UPI000A10A36E|nr:hypothetical protein [Thermoactinospora rubra]